MSLAGFRELSNAGVIFRSHLDGSRHELTPERSIQIQEQLDADISMVLDECTPFPIEETKAVTSLDLSMRWAERSRSVFRPRPGYSLFGIVQGSIYPALRLRSAALLKEICFDGYAIGGLGVGESREIMFSTLDVTISALPEDKPRYLMGIGKPTDIVSAVLRGIDMFDCVIPTRSGRTGQAFTRQGALNLQNACHQDNPDPLDRNCNCPACSGYSRAYLHHLVKAREILGSVLLTWHNLHYYQDLMAQLRQAIRVGNLTRELMNATVPLDSCRFFEN
jgi:queuine tRNA-ribosyltransferase